MAARITKPVMLACVLLCSLAAGCRTNPVTGSREVALVTTQQELALGDSQHPSVIFMYGGEYVDTDLKRYLGTIVLRLHRVSHRREMRTDFTVVNTSVINAFAMPGHVYATRGFLAQLENEAQFAAVMGHELSHVAAGHTAKDLTNWVILEAGMGTAGMVLGDSGGAQVALAAGELGVTMLGLSYSREQEVQADRVGTYYMALAGWDPREAISMQRLLHALEERKETVLDKYLSTHPPEKNRVSEIRLVIREKRLLERGYVQGDGVYAERWQGHLAQLRSVNRAYEHYDRGEANLAKREYDKALQAADEAVGVAGDQAPFYRLRGDALLGLNRLSDARAAFERSLAADRRYVPANVGLGWVAVGRRDYAEAERQFAVAVRGFPASVAAHYGLGLARYNQQEYKEAISPLETAAAALSQAPAAHYILAVCYDRTGQYRGAYDEYRYALAVGLEGEERRQTLQRVAVLGPLVGVPGAR